LNARSPITCQGTTDQLNARSLHIVRQQTFHSEAFKSTPTRLFKYCFNTELPTNTEQRVYKPVIQQFSYAAVSAGWSWVRRGLVEPLTPDLVMVGQLKQPTARPLHLYC